MKEVWAKTGLSERQFFEAVYGRMRALAGPRSPDLEDLVQIAAEQAFKSLRRFDGRSEIGTWLYGVCYRVLLNQRRWYKRWRVRFRVLEVSDERADEAPTAPALLEARARAHRLHRALAQMSDKYRAVVVLHDLEERTVRDIAEIVSVNELTVRSRLRDGRKQLTRLIQAQAEPPIGASHELTST